VIWAFGAGALLFMVTFLLYIAILRLLKLDMSVFLFPGVTAVTKIYGRRETISIVAIALVLLILVWVSWAYSGDGMYK
jgi:hypothetical protein